MFNSEYGNEIYIKNGTSDGSWGLFKPVNNSESDLPIMKLLRDYSIYISNKGKYNNFDSYSEYLRLNNSYRDYLNNRMNKNTLIKLESTPGYYINYNIEENLIKEISNIIMV